jgi:16S rRNA (guanine(1405)-N(7))-methyltransferase
MCAEQNVNEIEQIVANVRSSSKYRTVCQSTIRRIAIEEWVKGDALARSRKQRLKRATKGTKTRLHQAYGAYEARVDYERAYRSLDRAYASRQAQAIRLACQRILARHASTGERLSILGRFYADIFGHTGVPHALLDLACGLSPLSLPWMGLDRETNYHAYDIDAQRVAFLDRYLSLAEVEAHAHLQDVICDPPVEQGDVALLLKSSTCLERQKKGITLDLIDALDVRHVVVSFPVKSLGRREKGMWQHYERTFTEMLAHRTWPVTRLAFATELVFIVNKRQGEE